MSVHGELVAAVVEDFQNRETAMVRLSQHKHVPLVGRERAEMRSEPFEQSSPTDRIRASLLCVALEPQQQEHIYESFVDPSYELMDNIDVSLHFLNTARHPAERLAPPGEREFAEQVMEEIAAGWSRKDPAVQDLQSPLWESLRHRILTFARERKWKVSISAFYSTGSEVQPNWEAIQEFAFDRRTRL